MMRPSRRCRAAMICLVGATAMWLTDTANAFTSFTAARQVTAAHSPPPLRSLPVANAAKSSFPANPLSSGTARLSHQEQTALLAQAVEMRRIKQIESELSMKRKSPPLLSIRCKEAGYGDDIDAYENAIYLGEKARETLVTTNMGLVHYCVTEIVGTRSSSRARLNSLSREDLVQEGAIGLARAIDRWNADIGGKFSTYAVYWVRAKVLRCIAEKDDLLRVPEHMSTTARKVSKAAEKLGIVIDGERILSSVYASNQSWKEAEAAKALAEEAGVSQKQLTEAMRIQSRRRTGGYVTFESWMQKGMDLEADVSTDNSRAESTSAINMQELKETLSPYLRPKEMEALSWRYGLMTETTSSTKSRRRKNYIAEAEEELFGTQEAPSHSDMPARGKAGEAMSFAEVGKKMKVSAEYGRRLCQVALKKLQQAAEEGHLEPALLF